MASIKDLKKEIRYLLGDLIDVIVIHQVTTNKNGEASQKLINDIEDFYDKLSEKIHTPKVENKKAHFGGIRKEFEEGLVAFVERINGLS